MDALTIFAGGLSGGISASISGGKFWDGARQGVIVAGLNHAMHSTMRKGPGDGEPDPKKEDQANRLADRYKINEEKNIAYTTLAAAILESTEVGEVLSIVKQDLISTYGTTYQNEALQTYDKVLEIFRDIKGVLGDKNGKIYDATAYTISTGLIFKAGSLSLENSVLEIRIKFLNKYVWENRICNCLDSSGFGRGGAGSSY